MALGVALYLLAPWIARTLFGDPEMASTLRWSALALPATAFTDVALSATQGFKTMRPYASINLFFEPATRFVLTLLFVWAGLGADGAMVALVVTNTAAAVLSALALRRLMGAPAAAPRYAVRELLPYSVVGWLANLASNWLLWADTILLGIYLSPSQVSIYQVASRLALLGAVVVGPLGTSFAPAAADLFRRKRFDALQRAYALVAGWTLRLYVPAFVMLVVFPRELLAIFGPGFVVGTSVVVILASAQLVNTATGPNGYLITMSGRIRVQLALNVAALLANVALNVWLIPRYGIEGAAASWAACIVSFTLVRVMYVRSAMDMWPLDKRFGKTALAGLAALGAALLVNAVAEDLVAVLVGAAAVLGSYAGVLAVEGLDEEDRLVLATLRRRFHPRSA
jgi:O-antigen/teichoic acid export membrane protein